MKRLKKLLVFAFVFVTIASFACEAAAAKPSIELTDTYFSMNSVGGVSPTVCFRNNSGKTIKYIYFTMVPFNAVNDRVSCEVRGASASVGKVTGPISPTSLDNARVYYTAENPTQSRTPFATQQQISMDFYVGTRSRRNNKILLDMYGNPYYWNGDYLFKSDEKKVDPLTYLSADEIQNAVYSDVYEWDCMWYNSTIDHFIVTNAKVEYTNGTSENISQSALYSGHFQTNATYQPYFVMIQKYKPVYNYAFYKANNPDLAALYGDNEWKYLEHFVNSGMKEGRQASEEFNLEAYKASNPDLVGALGDNNQSYYEHYIASGKAEGRKAT